MEVVDFRKELIETVGKICTPGKGILAADQSPTSVLKKFNSINLQNTPENRKKYRSMLISSPGIENYISGIIFQEETARQQIQQGKTFVQYAKEKGIVPGIKVDKGTAPLHGGLPDQTFTKGLDSLQTMAKQFYQRGCRFAKWRAVIRISPQGPSTLSIRENAWGLARYAKICQANGLVPIIQPEVLADGTHSIQRCQQVSQIVFVQVFKACKDNNVFLQGALLKPNMTTYGLTSPDRQKGCFIQNAKRTLIVLSRTIPAALPGIVFLSGGQSEQEASQNLNAINKIEDIKKPWLLSFSFGRALQNSALKAWQGKDENVKAGQQKFLERAVANSEAQLGKYKGSSDESANQSLYQKDYRY